MTISAIRTVVPSPTTGGYGATISAPLLRWPVAQPGDNLDYSLDLTGLLADSMDYVSSAAFSASPSGAGELQVGLVTVVNTVVTAWLSGGVPGRRYVGKFDVSTFAGRTFEVLTSLLVSPTLGTPPLPAPPSSGFGTAVTWTAVQMLGLGFSRPLSVTSL